MQLKKLIFGLMIVVLVLSFPAVGQARNIDVEAGNVRVRTQQNGRISVDTGSNQIEVNKRRTYRVPWWQPWNYYRYRKSRNCGSSTYQRSTQTTRTNGRVYRSSISRSSCR